MKEGNILAFGAHGIELLRIDHFLGKGGFGSAWAVTDVNSAKPYCLKLIRATHLEGKALREIAVRVKNEASVRIPSKYVVQAIGFRAYSEREFGVLFELFEHAQTLREWFKQNQQTALWERKRNILRKALKGIAAAHLSNIVHRDIKPGNIMINDDDDVKIMDFGIGKFKHGLAGGGGVTVPGTKLGTMSYMAPELGIDASKADSRCDVYAFGHVIYEMITGKNVWVENGWMGNQGSSLMAFLDYMKTHSHLVDLSAFEFEDDPKVSGVLKKSLVFDVAQRYYSGEEMLADWFGVGEKQDVIRFDEISHQPTQARFRVLQGPTQGSVLPIRLVDGQSVILGRNHIDARNKYLSRRHVQIIRRQNRYFLSDVGSMNGTVYGGRLLDKDEEIELKNGDRIRFAETFLAFSLM